MENWGWPQIVVIVIYTLTFTVHALKAGEPQGEYNPLTAGIGIALGAIILYFGGFW